MEKRPSFVNSNSSSITRRSSHRQTRLQTKKVEYTSNSKRWAKKLWGNQQGIKISKENNVEDTMNRIMDKFQRYKNHELSPTKKILKPINQSRIVHRLTTIPRSETEKALLQAKKFSNPNMIWHGILQEHCENGKQIMTYMTEDGAQDFKIDKELYFDPYRDDYTLQVKNSRYQTETGEIKEARKYIMQLETNSCNTSANKIVGPPPKWPILSQYMARNHKSLPKIIKSRSKKYVKNNTTSALQSPKNLTATTSHNNSLSKSGSASLVSTLSPRKIFQMSKKLKRRKF